MRKKQPASYTLNRKSGKSRAKDIGAHENVPKQLL